LLSAGSRCTLAVVLAETTVAPPLKADEYAKPIMASRHDIESAKLKMLEARRVLDDYERLKGFVSSVEHTRLTQVFTKATQTYLKLSASQR
jgi:hypothetical protein